MVKSEITGKMYNPDNSSSLYISNIQQVYKFLRNGAADLLVDLLYTNTKNDCIVYVFKKCPRLCDLLTKWNNHELS